MELEEDATIIISLGREFPLEEVKTIAGRLAASNCLVPGFIAPSVGLMSLEALLYAELIDQTNTIVLVDRNVASRMAQIAREGAYRPLNRPSQFAVDLMALSQSMNLNIEPSIAFHELAQINGNDEALAELRWFRAADYGQARAWIDVALGREDALPIASPAEREEHDLARPLSRWRRNYAILLKAAELELSNLTPKERLRRLLEWMISDFFVAGPAAMYCAMYFSPFAAKAGMLKQLRSPERGRALAGIRNAAWDVTYLSEMVRRTTSDVYESKRYLLATADEAIAQVAPILFLDEGGAVGIEKDLARGLEKWWRTEASIVAANVAATMATAAGRPPPRPEAESQDYVGDLIIAGETKIMDC